MKKMRKLSTMLFGLIIMFTMVMSVNAADSDFSYNTAYGTGSNTWDPNQNNGAIQNYNNTNASDSTLGYSIYQGRNEPMRYTLNSSSVSYQGAIQIFGKNSTNWYEGSAIVDGNTSASTTTYTFTGYFPAFVVGSKPTQESVVTAGTSTPYTFLSGTGSTPFTSLSATNSDVTMTVIPSFTSDKNFIKLTFSLTSTSTTPLEVHFGAYSNIAVNSIQQPTITNLSEDGFQYLSSNGDGFNVILRNHSDGVKDVNQFWLNDRVNNTSADVATEYNNLFYKNESYTKSTTSNITGFAFSWDANVSSSAPVEKSILIGIGEFKPVVTITGDDEYNLDNNPKVEVDYTFNYEVENSGYKLYYQLNNGDIKTVSDTESGITAKSLSGKIDLTDDEALEECGKNIVTLWAGPADNSAREAAVSDIDSHTFTVTSSKCATPKTGINISYTIIGLLLIGGIGTFIYTKKFNKFPRV